MTDYKSAAALRRPGCSELQDAQEIYDAATTGAGIENVGLGRTLVYCTTFGQAGLVLMAAENLLDAALGDAWIWQASINLKPLYNTDGSTIYCVTIERRL